MTRRILVVDANRDAADSMRMLLEFSQHAVKAAYDRREGVDVARSWLPHAIVTDIGLPLLDGYKLARTVSSSLKPFPLLLALTGYDDRQEAFDGGFDYHFLVSDDTSLIVSILRSSFVDPTTTFVRHDRIRVVDCCICGQAWQEQFVSVNLTAFGELLGEIFPRCLQRPPHGASEMLTRLLVENRLVTDTQRLLSLSRRIHEVSEAIVSHCRESRRRNAPFSELTPLINELDEMPTWPPTLQEVIHAERECYQLRFT